MAEETAGAIIGRNVRHLRDAGLWTRSELAEKSGVSRQAIAHMELGISDRPRRGTIEKLAKGLGVDVETLLEGVYEAEGGHDDPLVAAAPSPKPGVLRETELRAETEQLLEMSTEEFAALLSTLGDGQLVDLQEQLMLLLRYRYGPKVFDTWGEVQAYMQSGEKERGDRASELLRMVIKALEAWANADSEARAKALEPA